MTAAPALPPLSEWESFYVIVGSSAGALTGLMLVVIALGAETRTAEGARAARAFATPTVVPFCVVLLLAALLSAPGQTAATLGRCLLAVGIGGLAYMGRVTFHARRQDAYAPVFSDSAWHMVLPVVAYAAVLAAGVLLRRSPAGALDVVAAAALLLLFVGIHNAWDSAIWMTTRRGSREASRRRRARRRRARLSEERRRRRYGSRSPNATGIRTARIAGKIPPRNPIASAYATPPASSRGVTVSRNATWLNDWKFSVAVS